MSQTIAEYEAEHGEPWTEMVLFDSATIYGDQIASASSGYVGLYVTEGTEFYARRNPEFFDEDGDLTEDSAQALARAIKELFAEDRYNVDVYVCMLEDQMFSVEIAQSVDPQTFTTDQASKLCDNLMSVWVNISDPGTFGWGYMFNRM